MKERGSEQEWEAMVEWLEGELGSLSDPVRANLPEDADSYFRGDEEERRMLLDRARGLLNVYDDRPALAGAARTGRGKERGGPPEIEVHLSEYTRHRGEVLAELIGLDPEVRAFRRRLPRFPLSREEADAFEGVFGAGRDKLERIAKRLARRYVWRVPRARRFVLTGQAPRPVSVAVASGPSTRPDVPSTSRIIITADAWVPSEEVAKAYKTAQRMMLGGDNRKVPDRVREVVRFVARRIREQGGEESWNEWWREWNRKQPKGWRYAAPHGFKQAFERFLHPEYRRPKWRPPDTS